MRRYVLTGIGSVVLTTVALSSHGEARMGYGGAHHLGGRGMHFGGAMPGSGHHGHGLFGCRRCR